MLQQNFNTIKVENDTDVGPEEDPVCMHNVVYVPSAFSMSETEPEVSFHLVSICKFVIFTRTRAHLCVYMQFFLYMSFAMSVSV